MKTRPATVYVTLDHANGEPLDFDTNLAELIDRSNGPGKPRFRIDEYRSKGPIYIQPERKHKA